MRGAAVNIGQLHGGKRRSVPGIIKALGKAHIKKMGLAGGFISVLGGNHAAAGVVYIRLDLVADRGVFVLARAGGKFYFEVPFVVGLGLPGSHEFFRAVKIRARIPPEKRRDKFLLVNGIFDRGVLQGRAEVIPGGALHQGRFAKFQ